jgi:hypothetical protein
VTPAPAEPDHLILGAATLLQGVEYFADLTGVAPRAGGKHVAMGTHNAVVRLGPQFYLEIIAIDPDGTRPSRPRWFDLDTVALQGALRERPQLIAWAARTSDLDAALARATISPGPAHPMARGDLRWRITIPDDGRRAGGGLVPTLIQWESAHPADSMPAAPVTLAQLAGSHPEPASIRGALAALGLQDALQVTYGASPRLAAMVRTPRGLVAI